LYPYVAIIEDFARLNSIDVRRHGESAQIALRHDDIVVTVTVPDSVLEWYVDVDDSAGSSIHDWCDYTGYDRTPVDQLAQDMADDIAQFLDRLSSRPLRVSRTSKKPTLEWFDAGVWSQAVPFVENSLSS